MRHLVEINSEMKLVINPALLTVDVFKKIWERDKSKDKSKAMMDIAYIFWFTDYRSFISDITDMHEKQKQIIQIIDETEKYRPDDLVEKAIQQYQKDAPLSLLFLNDVKVAVNELRKYFRELDLSLPDEKGKPIHNAKQVMDSIKSTGDLLEALEKHEIKIKKDLDLNNSVRGGESKGMYED